MMPEMVSPLSRVVMVSLIFVPPPFRAWTVGRPREGEFPSVLIRSEFCEESPACGGGVSSRLHVCGQAVHGRRPTSNEARRSARLRRRWAGGQRARGGGQRVSGAAQRARASCRLGASAAAARVKIRTRLEDGCR